MDPHKRSATIEVTGQRERLLGKGRFGADHDGYKAMLAAGRKHGERIWAVEGCNGIGRHVAQRLVADGALSDQLIGVCKGELSATSIVLR